MSETTNTDKKKQLQKYAVFAIMGIICAVSIWFIFAPSDADKEKEQQGTGLNTEMPNPDEQGMIGDKKDAYEQEQMKQKQNERMQSLQDYTMILGESNTPNEDLNLIGEEPAQVKRTQSSTSNRQASIGNSVAAYQDINRTLGNFYEKPKDDPEKEEMKQRLEELETRLGEKDDKQSAVDEQLALMEKSYQLAAKYMPQGQMQGDPSQGQSSDESLSKRIAKGSVGSNTSNGKTQVTAVRQVHNQTVTALFQQLSEEDLFIQYDQPRNFGFYSVDAKNDASLKNTISAVIDGEQTVVDGQSVRLRVTESLMVGEVLVPENTIITGLAKIQGERLDIQISNIEYQESVMAVELVAYDTDAQRGIYIPGSLEMDAMKEIAANMGQSVGQSFTITQSAGQQIAADLTKGLMQGTSQYLTKKIRQVKVTLKGGYRVMLMAKNS